MSPTLPRRALPLLAVLILGCGKDRDPFVPVLELSCSIPVDEILVGQRRDGIPALTDPTLIEAGITGPPLPLTDDRVLGIEVNGEAVAVPLRVFWYHEIVNLTVGGRAVALTHCPLTGSSLAFDRGPLADAAFGVSGLLYRNNLIMYDRSDTEESLWPQMLRGARCGDRDGADLPMVPAFESTWLGWIGLHPDTRVVSEETGWELDYQEYPYGDYQEPDNQDLLFPLVAGIDDRRPPKERVFGVPDGSGGIAYPFPELERLAAEAGDFAVVEGRTSDTEYVVFWDQRTEGAMAFVPEAEGQPLTLRVVNNRIVDAETGTIWDLRGVGVRGPLEGARLPPVADGFVAYWFAWPAFYPDLEIWEAP